MKWKTTPDGQNVAACPLEDWMSTRIGDLVVFQLRYHASDEAGSPQVRDEVFALPVELAEQFAEQIQESARTGATTQGIPVQPTEQ